MDLSHIAQEMHFKHVTEEKIEGSVESGGRRGGRRQQLLDDFKKREDTGI